MPPRKKAKRDANESQIVDALIAVGASVAQLNAKDIPDLLVGFRGRNFLIEVKSRYGKLTPGQRQWHENWAGETLVVKTIDDALRGIGAIN